MAKYDSADLLSRCQRYADRPAADLDVTPADWFAWLSEAQDALFSQWAAMPFASALYRDPVALVSDDGGLTYKFPGLAPGEFVTPMGAVELKASGASSLVLVPGAEWSTGADFVIEGDRIRFPRGVRRVDPPIARYIVEPSAISGDVEPVLKPVNARILLVYRALQFWCAKGGLRDPAPFEALERKAWYGDPSVGDYGILGMLQTQFAGAGAVGSDAGGAAWWYGIDTGDGYPGRPLP